MTATIASVAQIALSIPIMLTVITDTNITATTTTITITATRISATTTRQASTPSVRPVPSLDAASTDDGIAGLSPQCDHCW